MGGYHRWRFAIPFKVITIMSGATNLNFVVFLGASLVSEEFDFL